MLPRAWEAHRGAWPAAGGGVSGGSAEVCGCRATDVGTLLEGFVCEEVTIMVANKGEGVMVKEDLVTHRSIKEDAAFPAYQRPQLQTYQPVGSVSFAFLRPLLRTSSSWASPSSHPPSPPHTTRLASNGPQGQQDLSRASHRSSGYTPSSSRPSSGGPHLDSKAAVNRFALCAAHSAAAKAGTRRRRGRS